MDEKEPSGNGLFKGLPSFGKIKPFATVLCFGLLIGCVLGGVGFSKILAPSPEPVASTEPTPLPTSTPAPTPTPTPTPPPKNFINPLEVIQTFEISTLEYRYRDVLFREVEEDRFLIGFIKLDPAIKRYAVQYDGAIKIGIDGDEIKTEIGGLVGDKKKLIVIIPKAHIFSHEAPLSDTAVLLFDEAEHTEKVSIEQYIVDINESKKMIEREVEQSEFISQAEESALEQLEAFLNAIPDMQDQYIISFEIEE